MLKTFQQEVNYVRLELYPQVREKYHYVTDQQRFLELIK